MDCRCLSRSSSDVQSEILTGSIVKQQLTLRIQGKQDANTNKMGTERVERYSLEEKRDYRTMRVMWEGEESRISISSFHFSFLNSSQSPPLLYRRLYQLLLSFSLPEGATLRTLCHTFEINLRKRESKMGVEI